MPYAERTTVPVEKTKAEIENHADEVWRRASRRLPKAGKCGPLLPGPRGRDGGFGATGSTTTPG